MVKTIADRIQHLHPCVGARLWAAGYTNPAVAWAECKRGHWMLWLLGTQAGAPESEARKALVLCACECAEISLPYAKGSAARVCLDTARRWARGEATRIDDLRKDCGAAFCVGDDASDAAAFAASCATSTLLDIAIDASQAAESTAFATKIAGISDETAVYAACADIVRKHYPDPPTIEHA